MNKLTIATMALIILAIGYIAAGPYLALSGIKVALENNDSVKLQTHIDFQVLKQNLKDQINASAFQSSMGDANSPFSALAAGIVTTITDKVIDAMVTPSGIMAALSNKGFEGSVFDKEHKLFKDATISFDSHDMASIWVPVENSENARFVLKREGIDWKLINIIVPNLHQIFH